MSCQRGGYLSPPLETPGVDRLARRRTGKPDSFGRARVEVRFRGRGLLYIRRSAPRVQRNGERSL